MIHTLRFGNFYRAVVGAKSYLGITNSRGPANSQIQIPLMDKHDTGRRLLYLRFSLPSLMPPRMTNWLWPSGSGRRTGPNESRVIDPISELGSGFSLNFRFALSLDALTDR